MKLVLMFFLAVSSLGAAEVRMIASPMIPGLTRSDLWVAETSPNPRAILVLCPGMNGSAEQMVRDKTWQDFAARHRLGLAGLSYASENKDLFAGKGYTFPDQGSGDLLLGTLQKHYRKNLPLLLYGFSSGAYFTELFVAWKPDSVLAWCAHATGRYEENPAAWPPGIVSCGQMDSERYGAAMTHFKKARRAGGQLLWIGLPGQGHTWPTALHDFVRDYFAALLSNSGQGLWVDIDTETRLTDKQAASTPSLSAWLPSAQLESSWKKLNEP